MNPRFKYSPPIARTLGFEPLIMCEQKPMNSSAEELNQKNE
jgi:hypothetical protein